MFSITCNENLSAAQREKTSARKGLQGSVSITRKFIRLLIDFPQEIPKCVNITLLANRGMEGHYCAQFGAYTK
jgi:hypothetical protein